MRPRHVAPCSPGIRETRSNDCIVIARPVLEAAIRDQGDLSELLPSEPVTKPASRCSVKRYGVEPAHASA